MAYTSKYAFERFCGSLLQEWNEPCHDRTDVHIRDARCDGKVWGTSDNEYIMQAGTRIMNLVILFTLSTCRQVCLQASIGALASRGAAITCPPGQIPPRSFFGVPHLTGFPVQQLLETHAPTSVHGHWIPFNPPLASHPHILPQFGRVFAPSDFFENCWPPLVAIPDISADLSESDPRINERANVGHDLVSIGLCCHN